ncbi:MAG: APC family permease [Caldilineales bacterium]
MQSGQLKRELGVAGATLMGLGSIIGTGIFVSVGIAAGAAGPSVLIAIVIAAGVATCNGLSSAQLAASHPVSGGTYEYGYRYLRPALGFTAGWVFLLAKSASAATAALGFSGYLLDFLGIESARWLTPVALLAVLALTLIVLGGIRRSNLANTAIVSVTLLALAVFVLAGLPSVERSNFMPFFAVQGQGRLAGLLQASALMFVAYTGYGRIATLGEEVREPRRTIPRAIIATLVVSMGLYVAVAFVGVGTVGADALALTAGKLAAPLEAAARTFGVPGVPALVAVGAVTAMLGVLLNLILGLSRVLLAMGRRRDMPPAVARLDERGATPVIAVPVMGAVIAALVLVGDVRMTWSFSAFTVLVYYALTNLAALKLPSSARLYPRWLAWSGLAACLFLAFWVEARIWIVGLALIALGLLWHWLAGRLFPAASDG